MPKRKTSIVRVDASDVQGEGAFVVVKKMQWGEIKALSKQQRKANKLAKTDEEASEEMAIDMTDKLIASRVLEWNWVDDNGDPLPQPKDNPEVIDMCTDEEFEFLGTAIAGSEAVRKN